jgi:hypothetical protein
MEHVDEEEEHVEMVFLSEQGANKNLGLGVLEETNEDEQVPSSDESENIFDKLLRRTKDPIRGVLIKTLNDDESPPQNKEREEDQSELGQEGEV